MSHSCNSYLQNILQTHLLCSSSAAAAPTQATLSTPSPSKPVSGLHSCLSSLSCCAYFAKVHKPFFTLQWLIKCESERMTLLLKTFQSSQNKIQLPIMACGSAYKRSLTHPYHFSSFSTLQPHLPVFSVSNPSDRFLSQGVFTCSSLCSEYCHSRLLQNLIDLEGSCHQLLSCTAS